MTWLIDIGNTTTHIARLVNRSIRGGYRLPTGKIFLPGGPGRVFFCSVVPAVSHLWRKYLKRRGLFFREVTPESYPYEIDYPVNRIGADRLCNFLGVEEEYSFPAIVADFGTAVTIDAADRKKKYLGGAIFPGYRLSSAAIFKGTAKIKTTPLRFRADFLGRNTAESLGCGIEASLIGGAKFLIEKYKKLPGLSGSIVIATGGDAERIIGKDKIVQHIDPLLTLKGLRRFSRSST